MKKFFRKHIWLGLILLVLASVVVTGFVIRLFANRHSSIGVNSEVDTGAPQAGAEGVSIYACSPTVTVPPA